MSGMLERERERKRGRFTRRTPQAGRKGRRKEGKGEEGKRLLSLTNAFKRKRLTSASSIPMISVSSSHRRLIPGTVERGGMVSECLRRRESRKTEGRTEVKDPAEDGGHDEGVGHSGDGVGDLVSQLDVVAAKKERKKVRFAPNASREKERDENSLVDPTSSDDREAVKRGDALLGEETSHAVSDDSSDGMGSEDIEGFVHSNEELDPGGEVASDGSDESDGDSGRGLDETGGRGDGDKT